MLTIPELAIMLDLSQVTYKTTEDDVRHMVKVAKEYKTKTVGTFSSLFPLLKECMGDEPDVILSGGIGFPSGADKTIFKVLQTRDMLADGCKELDVMANISLIKSHNYKAALADVKAVAEASEGTLFKLIIEANRLTDDEIRHACDIAIEAGASFVKTGTGWSPNPTTLDMIKLIKNHVGDQIAIKASGGVRKLEQVLEMYDNGVTRYGVSSNQALQLFDEIRAQSK